MSKKERFLDRALSPVKLFYFIAHKSGSGQKTFFMTRPPALIVIPLLCVLVIAVVSLVIFVYLSQYRGSTLVPESLKKSDSTVSPEIGSDKIDTSEWLEFKDGTTGFELRYPRQSYLEDDEGESDKSFRVDKHFWGTRPSLHLNISVLSLKQSQEIESYCSDDSEGCIDLKYPMPSEWLSQKEIHETSMGGDNCSIGLCKVKKIGGIKFLESIGFWPPSASYNISFITYRNELRYELSLLDFVPKLIGEDEFLCNVLADSENITRCLQAISTRAVDKETLERLIIFDNFASNFKFTE